MADTPPTDADMDAWHANLLRVGRAAVAYMELLEPAFGREVAARMVAEWHTQFWAGSVDSDGVKWPPRSLALVPPPVQ